MKLTKLLALTLSLLMVLSCFSFTVFAEDEAVEEPVEVADTAPEEASAEDSADEEPVAEDPVEEETPEEPTEEEPSVEEPSEEEPTADEPAEEEIPADEPSEEETPADDSAEEETPADDSAEEETPAEEPAEEEVPEEDVAIDLFEGEEETQTVNDPIFAKLSLNTTPFKGLEGAMDVSYSAIDTVNNVPYMHFYAYEGQAPQLNNYNMSIALDPAQEYVYLAIYLRTNIAGQTGKTNDYSNNGEGVKTTSGGNSLAPSVGDGNWERMIYKIKTNGAPYIKHHAMYLFGQGYKATAGQYVDVAGFAYFYDQYSAENYSFAVADPGKTFKITYKNGDETLFEDLIASTQVVVPMRKVDVEGKELVAWTPENGNTNKLYSPNLDFSGITADTTLYAVLADSAVNANIPTQNVYFVKERGGSNSKDGLTAETPLATIAKAHEKIAAAESTTATVVIMGSYEETNGGTKLGVAGKTVTYMGYNDAATMWLTKSGSHQLAGDVVFSNINVVKSSSTEPIITAMGYDLTYDENCGTYVRNKCGSYRLAQFHYNGSFPATIDSTVTLKSGSYDKVMTTMNTVSSFYSVIQGKSTVVVDGATIATIAAAHDYQAAGWFKGTQSVIINSGTVGNVSFDANYGQSGVRYIQINGGDITGAVKTTDQIRGAHGNGVSATSAENYTGVSIVEVNGGTFTDKTIHVGSDMSYLTRVVIFNNGMADGFKVNDTKATVIKSDVGGTVKAKYTEPTAEKGYTSSLEGFTISTTKNYIYIDGEQVEKKDVYTFDAGTTHEVMFTDTAVYNVTWSVLGKNTTEKIAADATLSHTVDAKAVDKEHYYDFDGWYVGETKVDLSTYALTGDTTFTAKYNVVGDIAPTAVRDYGVLSQVDMSEDVNDEKYASRNPRSFYAEKKVFKGVEACEIAPYYNAADYEGRNNTAIRSIGIEGHNTYPANFSTYPRHSSESRYLSADVYDHILVKYYYVPGTNTATRQFYMWFQQNDDPRKLATINGKSVDMVGGKWTYAHFDLTGEHGKADSLQYHLRPMNGVKVTDLIANGEMIYIDSMTFLTEAPNIVTARFVDNSDNLLFEMDALSGETFEALNSGDIVAPAGKTFAGWTTTKGSTDLATLAITEDTTFYPVFSDNVVYVSAQGDDANNGLAPETAVLTLKKALELAATMAPTAGTTATVVVCGNGEVSGNIGGLSVNSGMITVTSKYGENDYTATARLSIPYGTPGGSTTVFVTFENIVFAGLTTGNGNTFLNATNNYFAFGDGITYDNTATGVLQRAVCFRAGGESGSVDYDKFGGLPLVFSPGVVVHLGSKNSSTTKNIYAVIGKGVTSVNVGNDGGTTKGTITGYTRIEVNGAKLPAVKMNSIDGNNAHYAIIFNDGTNVVAPTIAASNDGNTYKTFVLSGSEGYVFHHNADVSKVGEFTVEAYPADKAYYFVNGAEFDPATAFADNALVLAEGGTYKYDYADYKLTFKYDETTSVKYGKVGTAVVFDGTVTAPEHKTLAGWAVEGTTDIVDLATLTADTALVPVFNDVTYTVTFADGATASFTEIYGTEITVPEYAGTAPEGQNFVGWKNTASEEVLTAGAKYTVTGNASFEAKFEAKTVSNIEPDDATIPTDVVITVEEKEEAPSADKITAIETAIGELLNVNEVALSFEITAEKDSNPITELGGNVTFKIYFRAIANYDDAKTYRLFHFKADGTIKEECALTKNADHFAFTVSSLSPFVLAEVGVDDTVVQYIPVATYNKAAKTVTVSLSVKGAKLGFGSFGFAYDSAKLTNPVLAYKTTVAQAITASGISESAYKVADGVVRDTWMAWDGTQPVMIDASTDAVEFATITFTVSDDFSEADFRANPTNYFHVDTPTDTLNTKFYNNGCWRVDIWSDTVSNVGADPTTVADLTVTPATTVTVSGKFEKVGTSVISVEGTPGYDSKAVVTLYAKGSTTPYATATTDEAVGSGIDVTFSFADVELGEYYFTIEKNGYIKYTSSVVAVTEETDITGGVKVVLIPGDIKGSFNDKVGDGVVDIYDFIRVIRGFDTNAGAMLKGAVDINEDANVDISDLGLIKTYYKKSTADYGN